MTLDEAIKHAEEVMSENLEKTKGRKASDPVAINCTECAEEHRQLAEWLKELKQLREQEPCEDWYDVPSDEMTLGQARRAVKDLRKKLSEHLEQEPQSEWEQDHAILKAYSDGANEVLDKIRAEILQMPTISLNANDIYKADVLAIIDKYKTESEG